MRTGESSLGSIQHQQKAQDSKIAVLKEHSAGWTNTQGPETR